MNRKISRRALVRWISYALAIMLALGIGWFSSYRKEKDYQLKLEYSYMRAIEELSGYIEDLGNNLTKSLYTGTPQRLEVLSTQMFRDAGYAKNCLSEIPTSYVSLEKTYKFLSQVGNYSQSLAKKVSAGATLTDEERNNLKSLNEYCDMLREQLAVLQDEMYSGKISFEEVKKESRLVGNHQESPASIVDGFQDFEQSLTTYPTLIYDGPFSDHILEKEPEMTKGAAQITREEARQKAADAAGTDVKSLQDDTDEEGKMPSYTFGGGSLSIAVTKNGGYLSYMINSRGVEEDKIDLSQALNKAQAYLDRLRIGSLTQTYYEKSNNVLTVNYAHQDGDVTCYTDLVKVSVALDNGEIVGFDARGYLTNNRTRDFSSPRLTVSQAQAVLSPLLNVEKAKLALVPSLGENEVFCYEFKCRAEDNTDVLVYVNVETGAEEQILIVYTNEDGILTV